MSLLDFLAIGFLVVPSVGVLSASMFLNRGPHGPHGRRAV